VLKGILGQIYPHFCVLCGHIEPLSRLGETASRDICPSCQADLQVNRAACRRCALPISTFQADVICGQCLKKPPEYDAAWSAFLYAQPLEWMIQQLKFNDKLSYAHILADLMLPYVPFLKQRPDCIIPVPLHPRRLRQRGFNQAYELIRPIAEKLNIKIDTKYCWRKKYTVAQTGLNASSRRKNINAAFEFKNISNYQYVILFDDVITTGSTVNELSREMKKQGVERVEVWSLARAEKNH
jgi:ComF family protein